MSAAATGPEMTCYHCGSFDVTCWSTSASVRSGQENVGCCDECCPHDGEVMDPTTDDWADACQPVRQ